MLAWQGRGPSRKFQLADHALGKVHIGMLAREVAIYLERVVLPVYGAALDSARLALGTRLLEAGCGAGLPALLAGLRAAPASALDAPAALLAIARERLPDAEVRQGDLEALPFDDASFDTVSAVNSVYYAANREAACAS